jgi:hypothetical protein
MKKLLLFFPVLLYSSSCFANFIASGGFELVDGFNIFTYSTKNEFLIDLPNNSNTSDVFYAYSKACRLHETDYFKQLNLDFTDSSKAIYSIDVQQNNIYIKQ